MIQNYVLFFFNKLWQLFFGTPHLTPNSYFLKMSGLNLLCIEIGVSCLICYNFQNGVVRNPAMRPSTTSPAINQKLFVSQESIKDNFSIR